MNKMVFKKIFTHNLKGIDVTIPKNKITCIIGPSGSGKSSLAFDTINSICQKEYNDMIGLSGNIYTYKVDYYGDLMISVPLKQLNYNTNPRSTVATYYGIDKYVKTIFAEVNDVEADKFSFNKFGSSCKCCRGLGYELVPDISKIINYDSTLEEIPFEPWKATKKDYYKQLLLNVAKDEQIPLGIKFRDLDNGLKEFLLNGMGNIKYSIKYSQSSRKRNKTAPYISILKDIEQSLKKSENTYINYTKKSVCSECRGSRFSKTINVYKVCGKSISDIYLMDIISLELWVKECLNHTNLKLMSNNFNSIKKFCEQLIKLNLGYINLNRSISSLSGGEFQRLSLSQIINSKFENLLYILDEPLASLHAVEREDVIRQIKDISKNNTVLVVEHSLDFTKISDSIITLGESGGSSGGNLIEYNKYLSRYDNIKEVEKIYTNKSKDVSFDGIINNVSSFKIKFPINTCIAVAGLSGSGKTTFAKDILPQKLEKYKYISQKPIRGNAYSFIASYLDIADEIRNIFSKENAVDKSLFNFGNNGSGKCKKCNGLGYIDIDVYGLNKHSYVCPCCEGSRYEPKILKYKYKGYDINQIFNLEISEAITFFGKENKKIFKVLNNTINVGLGYLKLNQLISSLSGGENQRIKMLKSINKTSKNNILALDEPFQGLDNYEINNIMKTIYKYIEVGNTVVIIEHNLYAIKQCTYLYEFGLGSGDKGGNIIYEGRLEDIKNSNLSILKRYI